VGGQGTQVSSLRRYRTLAVDDRSCTNAAILASLLDTSIAFDALFEGGGAALAFDCSLEDTMHGNGDEARLRDDAGVTAGKGEEEEERPRLKLC
jgi:hypothetical protein